MNQAEAQRRINSTCVSCGGYGGGIGGDCPSCGGSGTTDTTSDGDLIACPWCGVQIGDLWEYEFGSNEELETECGDCSKPFTLRLAISIDYAARRA